MAYLLPGGAVFQEPIEVSSWLLPGGSVFRSVRDDVGSLDVQLGALTLQGVGALLISGSASIHLEGLTSGGAGVGNQGTALITLADLTVAAMSAPALTRLGNRQLRETGLRVKKGTLPTGRVKKGGMPRIF